MTYYEKEIRRIKKSCYANQHQLDTVIGTRRYINDHYDKALTLDHLSHKRFTSGFHLLRLFKRYYGQTPGQYLSAKRLEQSKHFLTRGYSVAESCYAVGFESACSFSTLFKSKFGITPGAFQKKQFSQRVQR